MTKALACSEGRAEQAEDLEMTMKCGIRTIHDLQKGRTLNFWALGTIKLTQSKLMSHFGKDNLDDCCARWTEGVEEQRTFG